MLDLNSRIFSPVYISSISSWSSLAHSTPSPYLSCNSPSSVSPCKDAAVRIPTPLPQSPASPPWGSLSVTSRLVKVKFLHAINEIRIPLCYNETILFNQDNQFQNQLRKLSNAWDTVTILKQKSEKYCKQVSCV